MTNATEVGVVAFYVDDIHNVHDGSYLMFEPQGVLDEADVRPQLLFLFFFLSPLTFVHFLLVLFQLSGELFQLGVPQSLVPNVQQQARLEAALQHGQRSCKVSRGGAVAHSTYPRLSKQAPVRMHKDGRDVALQLQHGGPDHAQHLGTCAMQGPDPLEGGGVGEGKLVREVSPLDALLRGLDLAQS